jgi:L-asparaginase/Glu-tRNA(Gln) amidotransferase subunit D
LNALGRALLEAIAVLETPTLLQKPGPHLTRDDAWLLANTIDAALAGCALTGLQARRYLQKRGVIVSGWLDGPKSRILLAALLMSRATRDQITIEFAAWRSMQ